MSDVKKEELINFFKIAIQAAHPSYCLPKHLSQQNYNQNTIILGAGKACSAMIQALEKHYEDLGIQNLLSGMGVTRHGYKLPTKYIPIIEAGHPIPDENSIIAARQAIKIAQNAGKEDLIIVLLSGGASALWSAPIPGITIGEKQEITKNLLRSGATIEEINCVRKHLSEIKGGRLAAQAYPAKMVTYAISDVPHDDIACIGSGPTVGDPTTCIEAETILNTYNIEVSDKLREIFLKQTNESLFPDDKTIRNSEYHLIATPKISINEVSKELINKGYQVNILGDSIEGEAKLVAKNHAKLALQAKQQDKRVALLSGGELTVKINGSGKGGPNQEYALALAIELEGKDGIYALAGDTDGTDGGSGAAADPAGAITTPETLTKAKEKHMDPASYLSNNDSGGFFENLGDLVTLGPTQTNVNDFRVILINP